MWMRDKEKQFEKGILPAIPLAYHQFIQGG
jgi:hypothetical protein